MIALLAAHYLGERRDCKKTLKGAGQPSALDLRRELRIPRSSTEVKGVVEYVFLILKQSTQDLTLREYSLGILQAFDLNQRGTTRNVELK